MSKVVLDKLVNDIIKHYNFEKGKCLIIRCFENKGVLSGCLTGWLDNTLSDYGKKQANYLSVNLFTNLSKQDHNIFTSDMLRAKESLNYLYAFDYSSIKISRTAALRDINYGEYEGYYYDGMSKDLKKEIANTKYSFERGESYLDVKFRAVHFLVKNYDTIINNFSVVLTHNLFITSLLRLKKPITSGDHFLINFSTSNNEKNTNIEDILSKYKNNYYKKSKGLISNSNSDEYLYYLNTFNNYLKEKITIETEFNLSNLEENESEVNDEK